MVATLRSCLDFIAFSGNMQWVQSHFEVLFKIHAFTFLQIERKALFYLFVFLHPTAGRSFSVSPMMHEREESYQEVVVEVLVTDGAKFALTSVLCQELSRWICFLRIFLIGIWNCISTKQSWSIMNIFFCKSLFLLIICCCMLCNIGHAH